MNTKKWTPEYVLEGFEERAEKIIRAYQLECKWRRVDAEYAKKKLTYLDFLKDEEANK